MIPVNHPRRVILQHRGVKVYCTYAGHQNPYIWRFTLNQDGRDAFDVRDGFPGGDQASLVDKSPLQLLVAWVDAKIESGEVA